MKLMNIQKQKQNKQFISLQIQKRKELEHEAYQEYLKEKNIIDEQMNNLIQKQR